MSVTLKEILPIGTIIKLKEADKRVMITGIKQIITETKEEFDYAGVPYPEGIIGFENQIFFQHDDIERIFFMGFIDIERQNFINEVSKFIAEADKQLDEGNQERK